MLDFPTYYGILDNNELRLGFVYTSILELLEQVSEQIIQVTNDEEILKVCNLLGIDEFISKLPNGIDTVIGETGYNISGGQKQLYC